MRRPGTYEGLRVYLTPGPTIPPSDFSTRKIVSVVKYGRQYFSLQVSKITLVGMTLKVYYTSTLEAGNISWVAGIPIIVTMNANFRRIQFFENGNLVSELTV